MNTIIAFVGMTGSGKSTASDYLIEQGWTYIRFGQVTIDKLKEAGKEINPDNEKMMRELLRQQYGMGAYATLSLPLIDEGVKQNHVVIDGLYSWTEYNILKDRYGGRIHVVAIYASPETRYHRLQNRTHDPKDPTYKMRPLTPEEARKRDFAEIENIEKGGPIAMADYTIINESTQEDFVEQIRLCSGQWTGKSETP